MPYDDIGKVARLKTNPHAGPPGGRGRSEPPSSGGDTGSKQVIQVATRCATLDEFVEKFATFAWEGSLVLPAASALPVGTQGRFIILLKDQTIAMRGRCRVTETKPTPVSSRNPAVKRVMMRVALLEMDEASRIVHRRLVALRSAPVPLPVPPEPSETTQIEPARGGTAPGAGAAPQPPVAAPGRPIDTIPTPTLAAQPVAAAPVPVAAVSRPAAAVPPAAAPPATAAPVPPIAPAKAPPPRVNLNRTMIGVGIAPISASPAAPRVPTPVPVPPVAASIPLGPVAPAAPAAPVTPPAPAARRSPTPPRVETRAPGAPDMLPANPLSGFDADDVESFIECTLLETSSEVPINIAGATPDESAAVATTVDALPKDGARETVTVRLAKKLPPGLQRPALRAAPYAPYAIAVVGIVVGVAIAYSGKRTPPAPPPVVVQAAAPPVSQPAIAAEAAKPAAPAPAPAAPAPTKPAAKAAEPEPVAAAPVAAKPAAKPAAPAPAAPEPVALDEKPAAAAARPAAEPTGDCTARVVTEPKDAKIIWAGTAIGRSPIDGARVPCGPAEVTIERERWQPVTINVNARAGAAAKVHERLRRPRTTLAVSSTPPGAQISVNHVAAGATPKKVDVSRFEQVQIRATLKGYQPWNKTLYLKDADAKLDIPLVPRK